MTSKKNLWLIAGLAVVIIGVLVVIGLPKWRAYVVRNQDERLYKNARTLLDQHRPAEALVVIDRRNRTVKAQTQEARGKWFSLEVSALDKAAQRIRLLELFDNSRNLFDVQEDAALIIARTIIHNADFENYDKFRAAWGRVEPISPAGLNWTRTPCCSKAGAQRPSNF